jgi:hypothetical protein
VYMFSDWIHVSKIFNHMHMPKIITIFKCIQAILNCCLYKVHSWMEADASRVGSAGGWKSAAGYKENQSKSMNPLMFLKKMH